MSRKKILKKFNDTGNCVINVDETIKQWKKHWIISEYDLKFTLIIPDRRSREGTLLKVQISKKQADELIRNLKLERLASLIFKKAGTWKLFKN